MDIRVVHRTDFKSAESILKSGFDLKKFGSATAKSGQAAIFGGHPRGIFLSVDEGFSPENLPPHPWNHRDRGVMIFGRAALVNPLVVNLEMEGEFYQKWLSLKYGATGSRLTAAIQKEGHDGIYCEESGEVVVFKPEQVTIEMKKSMESMRIYMEWRSSFPEGHEMKFKEWLEAVVSSSDVGEAIKKTLELRVGGKWYDTEIKREKTHPNSPPSVKFIGKLKNEKTDMGGPDYFFVSVYAILGRDKAPDFGFTYDSVSGSEDLRIAASIIYLDGRGGYVKLGERSSDHASQDPLAPYGWSLRVPYDLATWINSVIGKFDGYGKFDDDGNDEDPEPEWKPSSDPAGLVHV